MPTPYEEMAGFLDDMVDDTLGDSIEVKLSVGAWTPRTAFIIEETAGLDTQGFQITELDPLRQRQRIKIRKDYVPTVDQSVRFRAARLGGSSALWRPSGDMPQQEGRYWLIDIQRASS